MATEAWNLPDAFSSFMRRNLDAEGEGASEGIKVSPWKKGGIKLPASEAIFTAGPGKWPGISKNCFRFGALSYTLTPLTPPPTSLDLSP